MKLFLAATSFDISYGGPAFSVSLLGLALAEAGIKVGLWAPGGSAVVSEVIADHGNLRRLDDALEVSIAAFEPDLLHDNGIWMPHNHRIAHLARRQDIPRIVSTRGMLEPWARRHKRLKKSLAWHFYQRRDLRMASAIHTTAPMEAENLKRFFSGVPIHVIPNGVDIPKHNVGGEVYGATTTIKTALFLSRIHPKKGLPMLIEAWARLRPKGWRLEIAGPDEAGHRSQIEALVRAHGLAGVVTFSGPVDPADRGAVYGLADLFVLPTHSENFGMVVAEALAHGVPVLTTRGAPWPMLEKEGCGWWVDVSVDGLTEGLEKATALDSDTLGPMGEKGRAFAAREYGRKNIARTFVDVYEGLLSSRKQTSEDIFIK